MCAQMNSNKRQVEDGEEEEGVLLKVLNKGRGGGRRAMVTEVSETTIMRAIARLRTKKRGSLYSLSFLLFFP